MLENKVGKSFVDISKEIHELDGSYDSILQIASVDCGFELKP